METESTMTTLALDQLGWTPDHACLHHIIPLTSSKKISIQKRCYASGVRAQLTPFACHRALVTLNNAHAAHQDVTTRVLDLLDIARCERHRKAVASLAGPAAVEVLKVLSGPLWHAVSNSQQQQQHAEEALHEHVGLQLALADSSFTALSYEAMMRDGSPAEIRRIVTAPRSHPLQSQAEPHSTPLPSVACLPTQAATPSLTDPLLPIVFAPGRSQPQQQPRVSSREDDADVPKQRQTEFEVGNGVEVDVSGDLQWAFDFDAASTTATESVTNL
ncbi:hypothetical protein Slin15195_G129260 [Septoria linicola]|uniref:Uncharacterized protein n=1 Tax=Septoria linicola TaxID=215465 RepID=A0A9Q9B973_9PEZI|nr:hypothetical protein Slin14017_G121790 [Septoria linicola]USW59607.1 hypothetical protein Slin15195_G129260 [Septoria linicola]